jgi:hypothetical protein
MAQLFQEVNHNHKKIVMTENHINPQPQENNNADENNERFESDTQKVVRRHLENEDDVITDEDIRNVRVGMTPPLDEPTKAAVRESEERAADRKASNETAPGEQKITPWDVVEPEE